MAIIPAVADQESLLRSFEKLDFCACGDPDLAWEALRQMLAMFRAGSDAASLEDQKLHAQRHSARWNFFHDARHGGARFLLAYWLDNCGLTEHGSNVINSWLTVDGDVLLDWLEAVRAGGGEYQEAMQQLRFPEQS